MWLFRDMLQISGKYIILTSLLTKCLCDRMKWLRRAGSGPRAVVWRPCHTLRLFAYLQVVCASHPIHPPVCCRLKALATRNKLLLDPASVQPAFERNPVLSWTPVKITGLCCSYFFNRVAISQHRAGPEWDERSCYAGRLTANLFVHQPMAL